MKLHNRRILLKTAFNPYSGYGKDGIDLARSLDQEFGAEVHLDPTYVGIPLPTDILHLFCRERAKHYDIAISHEDPGALGFPERMANHSDYNIAWTMFEFTGFSTELNQFNRELRERLEFFDLVLAYDEVSKQALLPYMVDPDRLKILQGGYNADFWRLDDEEKKARDWDGTFNFCMNGTANKRKAPWLVLEAFKTLKDEYGDKFDASLHLKTTEMVFHPILEQWCEGVKIHFASWSESDMKKYYSKMNCLVAPSWGEGKNLPALEAQGTGIPVIVSNVGGHKMWADSSFAYLVEGPIEYHEENMGSMRVSVETLAEAMWHVYNNRAEAKRKGELASQIVPQKCDWFRVLERLEPIISQVPARQRD